MLLGRSTCNRGPPIAVDIHCGKMAVKAYSKFLQRALGPYRVTSKHHSRPERNFEYNFCRPSIAGTPICSGKMTKSTTSTTSPHRELPSETLANASTRQGKTKLMEVRQRSKQSIKSSTIPAIDAKENRGCHGVYTSPMTKQWTCAKNPATLHQRLLERVRNRENAA